MISGNLAIVEMLLENGANVNAQQSSGVTALMMAAEQVGGFSFIFFNPSVILLLSFVSWICIYRRSLAI